MWKDMSMTKTVNNSENSISLLSKWRRENKMNRAPALMLWSLFAAYLTLIAPTGLLLFTIPASAYYMAKAIKSLP
jgi:hypothetical protein